MISALETSTGIWELAIGPLVRFFGVFEDLAVSGPVFQGCPAPFSVRQILHSSWVSSSSSVLGSHDVFFFLVEVDLIVDLVFPGRFLARSMDWATFLSRAVA